MGYLSKPRLSGAALDARMARLPVHQRILTSITGLVQREVRGVLREEGWSDKDAEKEASRVADVAANKLLKDWRRSFPGVL